jgi:hypothetical protein
MRNDCPRIGVNGVHSESYQQGEACSWCGAEPDGCPKCGADLAHGYGLAGGGMGPYTYCENDSCDYFVKAQDPENAFFPSEKPK